MDLTDLNRLVFDKIDILNQEKMMSNRNLYMCSSPQLYEIKDFHFLEQDFAQNQAGQFYTDLCDFSLSANSLIFDTESKLWDENAFQKNDMFYNRIEDILNYSSFPVSDENPDNSFFLSNYVEKFLTGKEKYKFYYKNWKIVKDIINKYGKDSLPVKPMLEEWSKNVNKGIIEGEIKLKLLKEIKIANLKKENMKSDISLYLARSVKDGLGRDFLKTSFSPQNFYKNSSEWQSIQLNKNDIKSLIDKDGRYKIKHKIIPELVKFEYCFLTIKREWLEESILESPFWVYEQTITNYPVKLVFIKNLQCKSFLLENLIPSVEPYNAQKIEDKTKLNYNQRNKLRKNKLLTKYANPFVDKKKKRVKRTSKVSLKTKLLKPFGMKMVYHSLNSINCKITIFSTKKNRILNAKIKVYYNSILQTIPVRIKDNSFLFSISSSAKSSIEISHPAYKTKKIDLKFTRKQIVNKKIELPVSLENNLIVYDFYNQDELLLLGCIGTTVNKNPNPIKGIKYY